MHTSDSSFPFDISSNWIFSLTYQNYALARKTLALSSSTMHQLQNENTIQYSDMPYLQISVAHTSNS